MFQHVAEALYPTHCKTYLVHRDRSGIPVQHESEGYWRMMDPELAAASVLMERPDISDVAGARALALTLREETSSAQEETLGLVRVEERQIASSDPQITMTVRIYTPVGPVELRPAVVFFHGGAFVLGDLESEHPRCLRYSAEAGCVVVSVDYRLAPEHPAPPYFRGLAYAETGDFVKARRYWARALALSPREAGYRRDIAEQLATLDAVRAE